MNNNFIKKTLNNGIDVYLYKTSITNRFYISYIVNYGSNGYYNDFIYDGKKYNVMYGIAHFIEHLLIERSYMGNMLELYSKRDEYINALTSLYRTKYIIKGHLNLKESLTHIVNMVDKPVYTKDDIEKTKPAIYEEINRLYSRTKYMDTLHNNLYKPFTSIGNTRIGNYNDLKDLDIDTINLVYKAFYNVSNKYLVIAGNIDIDEVISTLEEIYTDIKVNPCKVEYIKYENMNDVRIKKDYTKDNIGLPKVCIKFKINTKYDLTKTYLSLLLNYKVNFNKTNDEINKLIKEGIISNSGIYYSFNKFLDYIEGTITVDSVKMEKALDYILSKYKKVSISEKDFNIFKKNTLLNEIRTMDDAISYAESFDKDDSLNFTLLVENFKYQECLDILNNIEYINYTSLIVNKNELDTKSF